MVKYSWRLPLQVEGDELARSIDLSSFTGIEQLEEVGACVCVCVCVYIYIST